MMARRLSVRRFDIYREFDAIACYDRFFACHNYWESFRQCYDALVTSGDLNIDYMVTITIDGDTLIVTNDGEWAIALLKWSDV